MWKRQVDLASRLTIRGYLVLLTLAILLPVLVFSSILYFRYYNSEQARIEAELLNDARQLALTVDRDLAGLLNILQTLTTTGRLAESDFAGFYQQAQRVNAMVGVHILLRERSGQQLANTRAAWGTPLPLEPLAGRQAKSSRRRKPYVSGVIIGAVARQPLFTITVPVVHQDRVTHFLNLSVPLERMYNLLRENLEPGRRAGIVDRAGTILARSERFTELAGTQAAPDFVARTRDRGGVWRGVNNAGEQVRTAYARADLADWVVYASMPETLIQQSLRDTFWARHGARCCVDRSSRF